MIEKMLLNSVRKAMLDNIEALDIKTLQKELKKHLQNEFMLEDALKEVRKYINQEPIVHDSYFGEDNYLEDLFDDYTKKLLEILDKVKEI